MPNAARYFLEDPVFLPQQHRGNNTGARLLSFTMAALFSLSMAVSGIYNSAFAQKNIQNDTNLFKSIQTIEQPHVKKDDLEKTLLLPGTEPGQITPLKSTSNLDMHINGTVSNASNGAGIDQAKVEIYNKTTMAFQTQTFTNSSGYYTAQFTYVGQNEHKPTLEDKLYPNPSSGQTTVRFNAEQSGTYNVIVADAAKKELYTRTLNVQQGTNEFTLTGGNAGAHLVTIYNNKGDIHTVKSIQTTSTGAGFSNSEPTRMPSSNLKSTMDNPNSLDSL